MQQYYKSFMNKQHPSDTLLEQTIIKAKALSEMERNSKADEFSVNLAILQNHRWLNWQLMLVTAAMFCLIAVGIWKWNAQITYTDLTKSAVIPNSDNVFYSKGVGDIRNSYLGKEKTDYYVFDKNAENLVVMAGQGEITVQTSELSDIGLQALYQTTPKKIRGYQVYFGKYVVDNKELLLAAFVKRNRQYYLEGENVTEKEMTACVQDLLKQ